MDEIIKLRQEIDEIDNKMMNLLERRYVLTNKIGIKKKQSKIQILDANRESQIFNKISKYSHSPQIRHIYNAILNESKKDQGK